MNALIIGFGSIGQRHAKILSSLGFSIIIVSRQQKTGYMTFLSLKQAFLHSRFDYVVIANKTSDHYETLMQVIDQGYGGPILVEKPVTDYLYDFQPKNEERVFVGYNLRFHPIMQKLKIMLINHKIISAQVYCGQYLPAWRKNRDYRQCYSANKEQGGGVVRDLSHEFDYIQWILGEWKSLTAIGGQYSSLQITSEDCCVILCSTERAPAVTIQINYVDRIFQRELIINTDTTTFRIDMVAGTIFMVGENGISNKYEYPPALNDSYVLMHNAILKGSGAEACTWQEALNTVKMVAAVEKSIRTGSSQSRSD